MCSRYSGKNEVVREYFIVAFGWAAVAVSFGRVCDGFVLVVFLNLFEVVF